MASGKRVLALLMVVLMIVSMAPVAMAATSNVEASAGSTAKVDFIYNPAYNLSGEFTYDDPNGIVESVKVVFVDLANGFSGSVIDGNGVWVVPVSDPVGIKITVRLEVKIKAGAATGSIVTVYFNGNYGDANKGVGDDTEVSEKALITVTKGESPAMPDKPDTPTNPSVPGGSSIDYSELERQIAIANGLNSATYTDASWDALEAALRVAKRALTSTSQNEVDKAAADLAEAIATLVKMSYADLLGALAEVSAFMKDNELADLWQQLLDAVERGKQLLTSGDQEAVNACAAEIRELLQKLKDKLKDLGNGEVIIEKVPVEVVVPPTEDFCNIPMHKVWPILFWISLAFNAAFIGVGAYVFAKKRTKQKDAMPLVDYDINDDV